MLEIHDQKREIVKHIDTGRRLGQLEAVEQCRFATEKTDIAEVQVPVAVANLAGRTAFVEQFPDIASCSRHASRRPSTSSRAKPARRAAARQ